MKSSRLQIKFYSLKIATKREKNTYETKSVLALRKYPENDDDGMELLLPKKVACMLKEKRKVGAEFRATFAPNHEIREHDFRRRPPTASQTQHRKLTRPPEANRGMCGYNYQRNGEIKVF